MAIIHTEIIGLKELTKKIDKITPAVKDKIKKALYMEGERIMAASKQLVPVDLGILRSSGHVRLPIELGKTIIVELGYGGAAKEYALYVHEGTGPRVGKPEFFPPPLKIEKWMRRKGIHADAWEVAQRIGERGLPPLKYLERPYRAAKSGMSKRIVMSMKGSLFR